MTQTPDRMIVLVNGEPREVDDGTALAFLVTSLTDRTAGIAVAVNGCVVPRSRWERDALRDGDAVEVVTAVQGG
jgi:sulfur carrier protein